MTFHNISTIQWEMWTFALLCRPFADPSDQKGPHADLCREKQTYLVTLIEGPLELAMQNPFWGPFWGPWWSSRAPWPLVEYHNGHKSVPTWLKGLKCIIYNVWCRNSKHSLKEARKFWGQFSGHVGSIEGLSRVLDLMRVHLSVRVPWYVFCCLEVHTIANMANFLGGPICLPLQ